MTEKGSLMVGSFGVTDVTPISGDELGIIELVPASSVTLTVVVPGHGADEVKILRFETGSLSELVLRPRL